MDESAKISESTADENEEEGELDPRVQGELELLNSACVEINTIENELEKARKRFQRMRVESTQRLNVVQQKLGRCVVKARPYFEMLILLEKAQSAIQKSAADFQESNTVYLAAKKRVSVAEEKMINDLHDKRPFDAAMQEMLNLATMTFSEAEKEKERCETEHMRRTHECTELKEKIKAIEQEHPKNIAKSRPYFEMKNDLESKLLSEKWNIEDLQRGLALAKDKYRMALQLLEQISEEVHLKRRLKLTFDLPERTPGVGAETPDVHLETASVSLDMLADTMSCASIDSDSHLHSIGDGASIHNDKMLAITKEESNNSIALDSAAAFLPPSTSTSSISQIDAVQHTSDAVLVATADKPEAGSGSSSKLTASGQGHMSFSADRAMFLRMQGAADASDTGSVGSASSLDDLSEFNKDVVELTQSVAAAPGNTVASKSSESRKKTRMNSKAAFPILTGLYDKNQHLSLNVKRPEPPK